MSTLSLLNNNSDHQKRTVDFEFNGPPPKTVESDSDEKSPDNLNGISSNCSLFHNDENSQILNAKPEDKKSNLSSSDRNPLTTINSKDNQNVLFDIMSLGLSSGGQNGGPLDSQSLLASALKNCTQLQLCQLLANSNPYATVNNNQGKMKESFLESYQILQNNMNNNSSGNSTCSPTGTSSTKSCCTSPLSSTGNSSKIELETSRKSLNGTNNTNNIQNSSVQENSESFTLTETDKSPQMSNNGSGQLPQDIQSNESSSVIDNFSGNSFLQSPSADGKRCSFCNKTFTCASALRIHFRKHSGERPYKCKFCCKAFSQNGTLKRHYQTCKSAPHNRGLGHVKIETPGERTMTSSNASNNTNSNNVLPSLVPTTSTCSSSPHPSLNSAFPEFANSLPQFTPPINKGNEDFMDVKFNLFTGGAIDQVQLLNKATEMLKNGFMPSFKYPASLPPQLSPQLPNNGNPRLFLQNLANTLSTNVHDGLNLSPLSLLHPLIGQVQSQEAQKRRSSTSSPFENVKQFKIDDIPASNSPHPSTSSTDLISELRANPRLFSCDHCNIFFVSEAERDLHGEFHAKNAPFTCSKCLAVMETPLNFQRHFLKEHN